MSKLLKQMMILGIVLLNLGIPSNLLASDCGEYCYDKETAPLVIVEIERCRIIKEQVNLLSSVNEELEKQLGMLENINKELQGQIDLLHEQIEVKDKMMDQQKISFETVLKEERKKSHLTSFRNLFIGTGVGALGVLGVLLFL